MMDYESTTVKELCLDEFKKLLDFMGKNYDWAKHQHLVFIKNIGSVDLTDEYKGKKGDKHQVFRDIELRVLTEISKEKREELDDMLET